MDFLHVSLGADSTALPSLADFHGTVLGLEVVEEGPDLVALRIGATRLDFRPGAAEPFYHFALLVPGDRWAEAIEWAAARATLLPGADGEVVFDFANWSALACYFHDPAGNIVELIAHRGLAETGVEGPFAGAELVGFSELGLVGDPAAMAAELERRLELELWDGTVDEEGRLGFLGERGRTLILCPPGRGWLPTGRPAEAHPLEAVLSGPPEGEASVDGYRIRRSGQPRRGGA